MQRIVFLDRATIAPQVTLRPPSFAHELIEHAATPRRPGGRAPGRRVDRHHQQGADPRRRARALPALKLIAVAATGYDVRRQGGLPARGVAVTNIRGYAINTVPEHTFALILALRRNVVGYRQAVHGGRWQKSGQFCFFDHPIRDLRGATLGIIGEGALGQRVAALGAGLRHAHAVRRAQGRERPRAALHAVATRCSRPATSSRCTRR